ncbi:MAG: YbaB/EbfC family nucleoid-associated protein [Chloroflexi bacterium]|nr:YbaB/EbfC family nucleoid-associated protein [Chloroflexota bacterium]
MPSGPTGHSQPQVEQMQSQMEQMQAALAAQVVTGTAGGGAVTIEMTGDQHLKSIKIKPEVVDPEDVEMLEDLIMAAFQEATDKVTALMSEMLGPLAGGLDLGGLM